MSKNDNQTIFLKDYAPSPYLIPQVELRIEIAEKQTRVVALLTIEPGPNTKADTPLVLHGEELKLASLAVDGAPLAEDHFEASEAGLTIYAPPHKKFVLETEVFLTPETNTELMGLYRSSGVWCTQCEPEGFRRITYFLDRPDVLSRYKVRLSADKKLAPVLLANGNLIEQGDLAGGQHFAVWEDPHPKPAYLFAIVAGDLGHISDSFTTASGQPVALAIYCEHGKEDQCAYAMDALKRSMAWDERRFGREYDLDVFNIVAVSDFNFGAMENKGLNIFNDRLVLASPDVATDGNYAAIERVIAHEYFHNWTGNRITCRDWFQLCLKEGLTVYRDQEFTSDERSRAVKRIEDVRGLRMSQFPEDGGPLAHPARPDRYSEINNFYTATVYNKGAEIVRMLATFLGTEAFRAGTDLYFERHDGEATTIEAWLKVFEDSSGRDLSQFGKWYLQAGTPQVTIEDTWDEGANTYRLKLSQNVAPTPGQPDKEPMMMPVKFGLIGPNGHPASWTSVTGGTVSGDMITFDTDSIELVFEGVANRPVPSLFREFSAPVKIQSDASQEDKLFLARHDADPFNRWQALQDVAMNIIVDAVRNGGAFRDADAVARLGDALGDTLKNDTLDDAFKAHALALPSEGNVSQHLGENIDPAMVHQVRRALVKNISKPLDTQLRDAYDSLAKTSNPYSIEAKPTRARALRNLCLSWLVQGGSASAADMAKAHYLGADNMTDRVAGLGTMVNGWTGDAPDMLDDFHQRFGDDMLVYDKWLALSASANDDSCLDRVRAIYAEASFPRTNPNRVRSLAGSFAMGNLAQFTRPDGQGFEFITGLCADVDPHNPQLAARMLTAFSAWEKYEPGRRKMAKAALDTMQAKGGWSCNTTDILARTLRG